MFCFMADFQPPPFWRQLYVLVLLLLVTMCNVATRNLPSYLITVPVPHCEEICVGKEFLAKPQCGSGYATQAMPTSYDLCQICRAQSKSVGLSVSRQRQTAGNTTHNIVVLSHNQTDMQARAAGLARGPSGLAFTQTRRYPNRSGRRMEGAADFYTMSDGACLHSWDYGVLVGYGFAAVFAAGSIPAGYVCDRYSRVAVATGALTLWSLATALQASAHDFWFLLTCRALLGFAQAFGMPATLSLAADYFTTRQCLVVALLSVGGSQLGAGCASFSVLVAGALGWRWAALLAGLLGLLLAPILLFTVPEPPRTEWSAPCSLAVVREEVFEKSRVAQLLIGAASAKLVASYSLAAFLPIYYARQGLEDYNSTAFACLNALAISLGGILSAMIGFSLSHLWRQTDPRAPCFIGLISSVASLPLICGVLLSNKFYYSMFSFFLLQLVGEAWFGPTVSLIQASVRRSVRGQAVSLALVASTLFANLGPALVGFLDFGDHMIWIHLLWVVLLANAVAGLAFLWTAREISIDPIAAGFGSTPGLNTDPKQGFRSASATHWAAF